MQSTTAQQLLNRLNDLLVDKYPREEPNDSFVSWYLEAEFGAIALKSALISGQSGDGGIDAITEAEGKVIVVQGNYALRPGKTRLAAEKLKAFRQLAETLVEGTEADFQVWLSKVAPGLRSEYRRRLRKVRGTPGKVEFWLVTTHESNADDTGLVKIKSFVDTASLARLWFEKKTPPFRSLEIRLSDDAEVQERHDRFRTHIGLADVRDFMLHDLDDSRWESLFASNVRTDLRSKVNDRIQASYEKTPDQFWLFNNGLYIVCEEVVKRKGYCVMRYPSIINGSQTLHAIRRSPKRHACRVIVRILEMKLATEKQLLEDVIASTNSQNPMKPFNLIAHRVEQVEIATAIHRYGLFYERRQNEWKNEMRNILKGYVPVSSTEVAQWIAVTSSWRIGVARSQPAKLIQDKQYNQLFGPLSAQLKRGDVERLLCVIWSGITVRTSLRHVRRNLTWAAKISRLALVRLVYESLSRITNHAALVNNAMERGRIGKTKSTRLPVAAIREFEGFLVEELEKLDRIGRSAGEDMTLANAYKRDDLTKSLYESAATLARQKRLAVVLEKYLRA